MIIHGDCIEEMAKMEENSIDAIVTDAPYAIAFMQKDFDTFDSPVAYYDFTVQWATQALRVLKPGGSMLCFGGTRTFHRLTCGLEDAGFIIKDCLMWLYGSGFPKSQDLGKMLDKRAGVEREVVFNPLSKPTPKSEKIGQISHSTHLVGEPKTFETPATDLARHWDGYKIGGIKPAWEPIIWSVKPPEGSYIDNVLKWGVGAVNVDECRVGEPATNSGWAKTGRKPEWYKQANEGWQRPWQDRVGNVDYEPSPKGRFPANLLLDESAAEMVDEQSGVSASPRTYERNADGYGRTSYQVGESIGTKSLNYGDTGGASRFFYTSKATDREPYNDHPTLKPTDIVEWLVRLVTRPGQLVLDPFAGSGTTGVACVHSGRDYILIDQDEHYCEIAEKRLSEVQMGMF